MDSPILPLFVFAIVLFLYIHITSNWKTSNDLEVYEADFESPQQLQEICHVKQPVLFTIENQDAGTFVSKFRASEMQKFDNHDVCVKDTHDYAAAATVNEDPAVDYVLLSLRSARRLLATDTKSQYFTEGNHHFLTESGLDHLAQTMDTHLKPPLSAYTKHDLMLGSPGVKTPFRYRMETHQYWMVTAGKIRVKLCPPKYTKQIPVVKDYENYEFRSTLNVWDAKSTEENRTVLAKIKVLDVDVGPGQVLFIPAYWWYSIQFSGDGNTTVAGFVYDNVVNVLAQSNHWMLYYMQQNNIKTRVAKTISTVNEEDLDSGPPPEVELPTKVHTSSGAPRTEIVTNAGTYVVDELTHA